MRNFRVGAALSMALWAGAAGAEAPSFDVPIDCSDPATCLVQNHVDMDAGSGFADFACGAAGYDGHKGVDFRVMAQALAAPVIAAADGVVRGTRDGEPEGLYMREGAAAVPSNRACGNGVLIEHGDGWQTQYCHMKRGSVAVSKGDAVRSGDRLGLVGLSGRTEFPHLHFSIRDGETYLDPFTGRALDGGCESAANDTLWAEETPEYWRPGSGPHGFGTGFATSSVSSAQIDAGVAVPNADSPAIVFYGRVIWLEEGDVQRLRLTGPRGFEPLTSNVDPTDAPKAQWVAFTGRKAPAGGLPRGTYRGTYTVERAGRIVLRIEDELVLR